MRKYHYLVLFMFGYAVLCPLAVRALYIEQGKKVEAFRAEEVSQTKEEGNVSAGNVSASEDKAVSENDAVPENAAVSENAAVPENAAGAGDGGVSGSDAASGNDTVSGDDAAPENPAAPGNDAVSENAAASENTAVPGNDAVPENAAAPGNDAASGKEQTPGNDAASGKEQTPGNDAAPGKEQTPGKETAPGKEQTPGNDTAPGNGAASEEAAKEGEKVPPGEFFKDSLFIGDSRTVGLAEYAVFGNADVFATEGLNVYRLYTSKNSIRNQKGSLGDILAGKQYRKIYLMLGINELGFNRENALARYETEVLKIRELQPNAKIILEASLHVTTERSGWDKTFNNEGLNKMNEAIRAIAEKYGFSYIDINEFFDDETGGLNGAYSRDGIHLMGKYYQQWVDWIRETGE